MQGIFISYRRLDSQSAAGRLADHLREHLPQVPLFRDVETIEPGVDFVDAINRALQSCGVLLAIIGPRWVSLTNSDGKRRLDDPNDYTRLEIVTALQRNDVRVIPVLVEGAQMPDASQLPEDLQPLCRRNAIELTDKRWEYDVTQLRDTLKKALSIASTPPRPEPHKPEPVPAAQPWYRRLTLKQWSYVAAGVVVLSVIVEQASYEEPDYLPTPYVPPNNVVDANVGNNSQVPTQTDTGSAAGLTGYWRDVEGGQYQVVQQGLQVAIQGSHPAGPVYGTGVITNNVLNLNYTINGVPYGAQLSMNADGSLVGRYASSYSGLSGSMALHRAQ
jgi:TIR domain